MVVEKKKEKQSSETLRACRANIHDLKRKYSNEEALVNSFRMLRSLISDIADSKNLMLSDEELNFLADDFITLFNEALTTVFKSRRN